MTRTARTLSVAGAIVAVLVLAMLLIPVPYVVLGPTTPTNTLGTDPAGGGPVCDVKGATNPTPQGDLALTTVGITRDKPTMGQAFVRWLLHSHEAVVPRSVLYPPGKSDQQADNEDKQQMADSRAAAVQAAEGELDTNDILVGGFTDGSKAVGALKVGDRITSVDGKAVHTVNDLHDVLLTVAPGTTVTLGVQRGTTTTDAKVTTTSVTENGVTRTLLGFTLPHVNASFNLTNVSGPSAGMMFALCIIDKLTPDNLAAGLKVAGTGDIGPDGDVGPIGGIQQKLYGAEANGYRFFFVPADNCSEAKAAHISGMQLIRVPRSTKSGDATVTSLHVARQDLMALKAGKTDLPTC
ncbi:MAG TPA: PDZ domain-containing protein [Mycobacteriales bacterium]|nr:PDZ domain-containing protein [Mycobacteriales bacterium]